MNLEEFGDKMIYKDLPFLVASNPYLAFIVLSAVLEFIARCRKTLKSIHDKNNTSGRYVDAIDNINALAPYRIYSRPRGKGHTNLLYTSLRCGLLHAGIPNSDIVLSSKKNDFSQNIIGCESLYSDVKNAWEEIKSIPSVKYYLQNNKGVIIRNTNLNDTV
ncbi:MAG: hypothetical protein IJV36_02060 [Prevotella sp.]|nr:hypothetical protein [Prevotella sp.]